MEKNNNILIEHILDSIAKIEKYVNELTIHDFIENDLVQDGVIRNFAVIGEATKNIHPDFRKEYADIPWKKMAGMRDILIHDYLGIDLYAVWDTIIKDLPDLKQKLITIIQTK